MTKFPAISEDRMRRMLQPPSGPVRLVIDTDAYNEIDDQFALAWAILSQDVLEIEGVYAAPYSYDFEHPLLEETTELLGANPRAHLPENLQPYVEWASLASKTSRMTNPHGIFDAAEGMELSYQEILKVYDLLGKDPGGIVFRGSPGYLTSLDKPIQSAAADHLIERALVDTDRPLYVAALGCLPNIASAILIEPEIIKNIVVLWTASFPSSVYLSNAPSFNLIQDTLSSQLLFDCGVPQVYLPGYHIGAQLRISLPEMESWVRGQGKMGDYLYYLFTHYLEYKWQDDGALFGRTKIIWDLINIAWLLNPDWVPSRLVQAPILTDDLFWKADPGRHLMLEAYDIDRDAIYRDLLSKLEKAR